MIDISDHKWEYRRFDRSVTYPDVWATTKRQDGMRRIWARGRSIRARASCSSARRSRSRRPHHRGARGARRARRRAHTTARGRTVLPGSDRCAHPSRLGRLSLARVRAAARCKGEDPRPRELGWFVLARSCRALLESGRDDDPRRRLVRRRGDRDAPRRRARADAGAADPLVRADRLGHLARRPDVRHDVRGGGRPVGDAPGRARAAPAGRRLHQADGDRRALGRARGSRAGAADPRGDRGDRRRGAPDRPARRRARRGPRRARGSRSRRASTRSSTASRSTARPELLARMAESGQVLVPTLSTFHDLAERFAPNGCRASSSRPSDSSRRRTRRSRRPRDGGRHARHGLRLGPAGIRAVGARAHGRGRPRRARRLRPRPPAARPRSAPDDIGRLAAGAVGDLVVLDGDPVADPRVLVRPGRMRLVLQAGVPVAGRDLDPPRWDGRPGAADDAEIAEPIGMPTCCLPSSAISSGRT